MPKQAYRRIREIPQSCWFLGLFIFQVSSAFAIRPTLSRAEVLLQSKGEAQGQLKPLSPSDSKEKVRFQLQRISDGILCPINDRDCEDRDIWWKNFTLLASDGHTLHVVSIPFPTLDRSKKHFQTTLKAAEKTLRDNPESYNKGELVGERALGSFREVKDSKSPSDSAPYYRLFWTWEKNYWELSGEHLEDVLALETRLKEEGTRAIWTWH